MPLPKLNHRPTDDYVDRGTVGDDVIPGQSARREFRGPPPVRPDQTPETEIQVKMGKMVFPRSELDLRTNPFRIHAFKIGKVDHTFQTEFPISARPGDLVNLRGHWIERGGKSRFKASIVVLGMKRDVRGITAWLKKLPGIGAATGTMLVRKFGEDIAESLDDVGAMMSAGLPRHKAELIAETYRERNAEARAVQMLHGYQLGDVTIQKCLETYGLGIMALLDRNPYELANTIKGVGFKTADEIALRAGIPKDSDLRIVAAIRDSLSEAIENDGNTGLPIDELLARTVRKTEQPLQVVQAHLGAVIGDKHHCLDMTTGLVTWKRMRDTEDTLARHLLNMLDQDRPERSRVEAALARAEDKVAREMREKKGIEFRLDPGQRSAALLALSNNVCVITGGPGTGKSTLLRVLLMALKDLGRTVVCAAPTGRAAKRINETTGVEASTCHKMLKYEGDGFKVTESNPFDQDWFVVDEFSMVDTRLAHSFVTAIRLGSGLTIVGDVDQLPPVGPGQVLRDIIASGTVPVARLETVHRQVEGSAIAVAAMRINRGDHPCRSDDPPNMSGYYSREVKEAHDISDAVIQIMTKQKKYDSLRDIQVLTVKKKGDGGVEDLNRRIKEALNPVLDDGNSIKLGFSSYTVGDRVMQNRNSYEKNVSNGEVGTVVSVGTRELKNKEGKRVPCFTVDFGAVTATYTMADHRDVDLAYAATVHKSQGCEFKVVIFAFHNSQAWNVKRNLVYTALTRAKEWYCFVGSDRALRGAIGAADDGTRHTGLCRKLLDARPHLKVPKASADPSEVEEPVEDIPEQPFLPM